MLECLRRSVLVVIASLTSLAVPAIAAAQSNLVRPALDWMTVRTRYFDVHYPAPMAEWTTDLVSRLDAVHDAVSAFVGYAPTHRVTLIIEDPTSQSNGFANAPLATPLIVLWPTPPDPSGMLGAYRDWPELVAVHEYAHIAHLVRPTRNPRERWFWRLLPVRLGPITLRAPRWVVEGYATYVEGRLTGSGRPHGAARAAYLRQWALEGKLPTYAQLSSGGDFASSSMAYLAGSAFLEWLVDQKGDSSLVAVWRRLTARQPRSFAQAFAGVYGGPPDELYGRFTVDLTRRALAARDTLASAGLDTGVLVQRRRWATGEPAVSADGRRIAIALPARDTPGPLVVWRTEEPADSARDRRARERLLERDPEDVPAVPGEPRPRTPIATLRPLAGRAFYSPRFFADSSRLLVVHDDPLGDGAYRPDLYVWNYRAGALRRITHGAGVRDADPLPDGRAAVGVRCENGICDLVRVDLTSGAVRVLRRATPSAPFYRPRVSPDGQHAIVSVLHEGHWRLALLPVHDTTADAHGDAALAFVGPDDGASRYDASFLPGGRAVVCVSEAGGVPNLEIVDLGAGTTRSLTRVTGAVFAPVAIPTDSTVLFLALHARGLDVRRISTAGSQPAGVVALPASLLPAVPAPAVAVDTFARRAPGPSHPYGAGPRRHRVLPGGNYSSEGGMASLSLVGEDPVGRLGYVLTGGFGDRSAWRGGSLTATWRGNRPIVPGTLSIDGTVFRAEQRPSRQRALGDDVPALAARLDAAYTGATLGTATVRDFGMARLQVRVGANIGSLQRPGVDAAARGLVFGESRGVVRLQRGDYRADLALGAHASRGATGGLGWARAIGSFTADVATPFGGLRLDGALGGTDGGGGVFEQFAIGGWPSPFIDAPVMSQRLPMPTLPAAFAIGRRVATARASTSFAGWRPFYWLGSAGDRLDRWARVAGLDGEYAIPAFPAFAIPSVSIRAGAAYSWDAPFRHRVGVYAGVTYRP